MKMDTKDQANDHSSQYGTQSPPSFSLLPRQIAVLQSNSPKSCDSGDTSQDPKQSSFSNSSTSCSPGSTSMRKRRVYSVNGPLSSSSRESNLKKCEKNPCSPVIKSHTNAANCPSSPLVRPIMTLSKMTICSPKPMSQTSNTSYRSPFVNYSGSSPTVRDYNPNPFSCDSPSPRQVPITVLSSAQDRSSFSNSGLTTPMENSYVQCNKTLSTPNKERLPIFSSPKVIQTPQQQRSTPKTPSSGTFRLSPRICGSPIKSPKPLMPMFQPNNVFSSPRLTPLRKTILSPRISPSVIVAKSPASTQAFNPIKSGTKGLDLKSQSTSSTLVPRYLSPEGKNSSIDDGSQEDECFMGVQMDGLLRGFGNRKKEAKNEHLPNSRTFKRRISRTVDHPKNNDHGNHLRLPRYDSLVLSDSESNNSVDRLHKDKISDPPIQTLSLERRTPSRASQYSAPRVTPSLMSPPGNKTNSKCLSVLSPTNDNDDFDNFFNNKKKHHSPYDSDGSLSDIDDNDNFFLSSPCVVAEEKNEAADTVPTVSSSCQRQGRAAKQRKIHQDKIDNESKDQTDQQLSHPDTKENSLHHSHDSVDNKTFEAIASAASLYGMDIIQEHSISNVSLVEMNRSKTRCSSGKYRSKTPCMRRDSSESSLSTYGLNLEDTLLYEDSSRDLVTPPIVAQTQSMLSPPPIRETDLTTFRLPPSEVT